MSTPPRRGFEDKATQIVCGDWTQILCIADNHIPSKDWRELEKRIAHALQKAYGEGLGRAANIALDYYEWHDPDSIRGCAIQISERIRALIEEI